MVTDYPQVDIPEIGFNHPETQSCIATPAPDKYPMTGETSHKVTVGVFDCMTGKTILLANRVDPTCLGGVRLDYDGQRLDDTVSHRLDSVRELLKNTVL